MLAGVAGVLVLVVLPGAWVTFGLPLAGIPFWARLLTGMALAPLIVCLQFYTVRVLGVSFEFSVYLLLLVNLPPAYFIWKHCDELSIPDLRSMGGWILVLLLPMAFLGLQFFDPQIRMLTGHAWMHTDYIYMLANGDLLLDDPELVGIRLAYPWAEHVHQAMLSYLLGSPPASNYFWTNLLCLLLSCGFVAGIVSELGGNRFSKIASAVWLFFGLDFGGYVLQQIVPAAFARDYPIWVDWRAVPWLLTFFGFTPMNFALAMFVAIVYLVMRQQRLGEFTRYPIFVVFLLLCEIGIMYPILILPAGAVVGASILAMCFDALASRKQVPYKASLALGMIVFIAGCVTLAHLKVLTQDRGSEVMVAFSTMWEMKIKAVAIAAATFPLLVCLPFVFARCRKAARSAIVVLALGALASVILYVVFDVRNYRNEYKYIFTLAICLAPFPSLALEPLMARLERQAVPVFALITLILAAPFAHKVYNFWPFGEQFGDGNLPVFDARNFDLRLDGSNQLAGLMDAIRQKTPTDSILVLENSKIHFPTLTRRRLFVPPVDRNPLGVHVKADNLLKKSRGYDAHMIDERRLTLRELFHSDDASKRAQSLAEILKFNRPVAIVLDEQRDAALLDWLITVGIGRSEYNGNGSILWLIKPADAFPLHASGSFD